MIVIYQACYGCKRRVQGSGKHVLEPTRSVNGKHSVWRVQGQQIRRGSKHECDPYGDVHKYRKWKKEEVRSSTLPFLPPTFPLSLSLYQSPFPRVDYDIWPYIHGVSLVYIRYVICTLNVTHLGGTILCNNHIKIRPSTLFFIFCFRSYNIFESEGVYFEYGCLKTMYCIADKCLKSSALSYITEISPMEHASSARIVIHICESTTKHIHVQAGLFTLIEKSSSYFCQYVVDKLLRTVKMSSTSYFCENVVDKLLLCICRGQVTSVS